MQCEAKLFPRVHAFGIDTGSQVLRVRIFSHSGCPVLFAFVPSRLAAPLSNPCTTFAVTGGMKVRFAFGWIVYVTVVCDLRDPKAISRR